MATAEYNTVTSLEAPFQKPAVRSENAAGKAMTITELSTRGALLFQPRVYEDERGCFLETFNQEIVDRIGGATFVQDNESHSKRGVLRGLHYQVTKPQGKLVRVVAGEILDVIVDLRKSSPTFGKHCSTVLSGHNRHILWVPEGFAHGFLTLSESAVFVYKCTDRYTPQHERTLIWNDAALGIEWPLDVSPVLSAKDALGLLLRDSEVFL
jgi:dTDP-4-dehydrorhamnose 3,5-epimerase